MAPNDAQPAPPGLTRDLKPSKVLVSVFRRADIIPRHLSSDFHREGVARKGRERPGVRDPHRRAHHKATVPSSQVPVGAWMLGGPHHQLSR